MLSETWTNDRMDFDISGYVSYPMHRPKIRKTAKRDSGGMIVYVRNELYCKLKFLKADQYDIMWFLLEKSLFNAEHDIIVRRAGLLWSQQDFEWRWSVPLFKCLTVLEFSFILFDLCLLITFFNLIMNYVPIVTFWIFTYHKIWILSIMFCSIWSYWIINFLACLEVSWRVVS